MKRYVIFIMYVVLLLLTVEATYAGQNTETISYFNAQYGFKFYYPKTWELQTQADPLAICEYEINLRPENWLTSRASKEYRRNSDFPVQVFLCPRDFESAAKSQHYKKTDGGWVSTSKGIEMEAEDISGIGWIGIAGEVPFKSITKTGKEGPVLFLQHAILAIDKKRSVLIIVEEMEAPWDAWDIDNLLRSIQILPPEKETTYHASYDCDKALSDIEKAVCQNEALAKADLEMYKVYQELMSKQGNDKRRKLRQEQRAWLNERDSQCQSDPLDICLQKMYAKRLGELMGWK